jgi:threonyl-tRNA synthetase
VEIDRSDERMQKKIRNAQKQKVPFMMLAGEEDQARGAVSFRFRDGSQRNFVPIAEAVAEIVRYVAARDNRDPTAPTTAPTTAGDRAGDGMGELSAQA